jgi:4-hydroxy-tetrahydrodipicolinate synthase
MQPLEPGVWGILPTPFNGDDLAVDPASLVAALELFTVAGTTGVVALGVFGEAAQLNSEERAQVVSHATEAFGADRVVVGLTSLDTAQACAEAVAAVRAAQAPLAAFMVQINSTSGADVTQHLQTITEASGLPIVLQDYPVASGIRVGTDLILEVTERSGVVVAVKCESPPTSPAIATLAAATDIPLFGGLGGIGLLDELLAGAAGAMTGFSYPEVLVEVIDAWRTGGYDAARTAILPWLPLINFEAQLQVGLSIRKENLRRRGVLASGAVRPPAVPFPANLTPLVDAHQRAVLELTH